MEVAEVLAPLPSIAAELAALDIAPVPGDIHTWVPEQNKVSVLVVFPLLPVFLLISQDSPFATTYSSAGSRVSFSRCFLMASCHPDRS